MGIGLARIQCNDMLSGQCTTKNDSLWSFSWLRFHLTRDFKRPKRRICICIFLCTAFFVQKGRSRWMKRAAKAFEVISTIIMQRGKFSTESSQLDCLLPAILGACRSGFHMAQGSCGWLEASSTLAACQSLSPIEVTLDSNVTCCWAWLQPTKTRLLSQWRMGFVGLFYRTRSLARVWNYMDI